MSLPGGPLRVMGRARQSTASGLNASFGEKDVGDHAGTGDPALLTRHLAVDLRTRLDLEGWLRLSNEGA